MILLGSLRYRQAEKIHNRVTSEVRQEEVDDQLKRLLDMSLRGIITDEEYKQKKAELINRKFDISAKGDGNGDWLEHFKNFLTLAHQASYIAAGANHDAQRDFLQKIVSNLKLYNKTLVVSYTSEFKLAAETANEEMGSLTGPNSWEAGIIANSNPTPTEVVKYLSK